MHESPCVGPLLRYNLLIKSVLLYKPLKMPGTGLEPAQLSLPDPKSAFVETVKRQFIISACDGQLLQLVLQTIPSTESKMVACHVPLCACHARQTNSSGYNDTMSPTIEKIRDEVRHLPFGERVRLVKELEDDLDSDEPAARTDVEAAWDAEEQSRVHEIMSGEVKLMQRDDLTRRLNEVRAKHTA